MINLSERLLAIAQEVGKGETVADIGTDHGFLPLYLWEKGISPKVIMTDISQGSLAKARENCSRWYPDTEFDLRLGDGIRDRPGGGRYGGYCRYGRHPDHRDTEEGSGQGKRTEKADTAAQEQHRHIETLALQQRIFHNKRKTGKRRTVYLRDNHSDTQRGGSHKEHGTERIEYQYPHSLIKFAGLTEEYLTCKLNIEKNILSGMEKSSSTGPNQIRSQQYRIDYIERLIRQL